MSELPLTIQVTQEDIDNGEVGSGNGTVGFDPIANALHRLGYPENISVDCMKEHDNVWAVYLDEDSIEISKPLYALPQSAIEFDIRFHDLELPVQPFEFTLERFSL